MSTVSIAQGALQGVQASNYVAFKGIPYAKPPVGELRFKAPQPAEGWSNVRDASSHGPVCPQFNEREQRLETGSEDCLYINVFTPKLAPDDPFPVMVWIHGGGFYTGSGDSDVYGPEFLVGQDVVLVTFNYRLEAFGFLCLDNEEVPGNAGLKDQLLALQWVKANIAAFGGDANKITIFGCSAGSASVSYHMLSPRSAGLFERAICQSGICFSEWSYGLYGRQRAFQLAEKLGYFTDDENKLLDFLRSVPHMSLVGHSLPDVSTDLADSIVFGPVIEKIFPNNPPFLCEHPVDTVKKGAFTRVPLIIGYTSAEGIELVRHFSGMANKWKENIDVNVPRELKLQWSVDRIENVAKLVMKFYFNCQPVTEHNMQALVDLQTDMQFAYNIMRFAGLFSRECPVYFYKWTLETERNYVKQMYGMEHLHGVCHGDDLPYLFNISKLKRTVNNRTRPIINQIVQLWTNFARTGNPTPHDEVKWLPFNETDRDYLNIHFKLQPAQCPDHERYLFWHSIYNNICDCK